MLARLLAAVSRSRFVNHELTDEPAVRALQDATGRQAVVAVYDDEAVPYADSVTLQRELDVSLPDGYRLELAGRQAHGFVPTGRTIRACAVPAADPPVVLLARNSLVGWENEVRTFVIAHEFAHLVAGFEFDFNFDPDPGFKLGGDTVLEAAVAPSASGNPETDTTAGLIPTRRTVRKRIDRLLADAREIGPSTVAGVRGLLAARAEYDAGCIHAEIRTALPEERRTPKRTMAEYHAAERRSTVGGDGFERDAVAIRNAAKYLPLPYEPPIEANAHAALEQPLPAYLDWVADRLATIER